MEIVGFDQFGDQLHTWQQIPQLTKQVPRSISAENTNNQAKAI